LSAVYIGYADPMTLEFLCVNDVLEHRVRVAGVEFDHDAVSRAVIGC
jgi:hypothetical protein